MKRIIAFILAVLLLMICFCGCRKEPLPDDTEGNSSQATDPPAPQSDVVEYSYYGGEPETPLITEDLDVFYDGIIINDKTQIDKLEQKLGVYFDIEGENIEMLYSLDSQVYDFYYCTLYYPSKQNAEIEINYMVNETLGITKIRSIYISKGAVGRGISIGDSPDEIVKVYGEPIEKGIYRYYSNAENNSYSIWFFVDSQTKKIIGVDILYEITEIMEEWELYYVTD